ncbi:MAG: glucokinase [Dehalococcoidia bacterium]
MLLAGDVGATKTSLALIAPDRGAHAPVREVTLSSNRYPSLEALVLEFLHDAGVPVERACFGVAGPVVAGRAQLTNLSWVLDEVSLVRGLGITAVRLLNDLEATATAMPFLEAGDLTTLAPGEPVAHGAIAVIAPGTGLGAAYLTWDGTCYQAHPSEAGHTDFAPRNAHQADLLAYLRARHDHVSYERVCSGRGLPNIYAWLKERRCDPEPPWLTEQLAAASDPTPVIIRAARHGGSGAALCRATLDTFVDILAAEAGNLALAVMATGGVYIGGGMPLHIMPQLDCERFLTAFRNKGRLTDLLERIPVHIIRTAKAALLGASIEVIRAE